MAGFEATTNDARDARFTLAVAAMPPMPVPLGPRSADDAKPTATAKPPPNKQDRVADTQTGPTSKQSDKCGDSPWTTAFTLVGTAGGVVLDTVALTQQITGGRFDFLRDQSVPDHAKLVLALARSGSHAALVTSVPRIPCQSLRLLSLAALGLEGSVFLVYGISKANESPDPGTSVAAASVASGVNLTQAAFTVASTEIFRIKDPTWRKFGYLVGAGADLAVAFPAFALTYGSLPRVPSTLEQNGPAIWLSSFLNAGASLGNAGLDLVLEWKDAADRAKAKGNASAHVRFASLDRTAISGEPMTGLGVKGTGDPDMVLAKILGGRKK